MKKSHMNPAGRLALALALVITGCFYMIVQLLASSGVIPGADGAIDQRKQLAITLAERVNTVEGVFFDRYGDPITTEAEAGQSATCTDPEAFSYLIGHNSAVYGSSGLRARYRTTSGGKDGVGPEIHLTIDRALQEFCYRLLDGTEGSCVVLDAETGEGLALTSRSDPELGLNLDKLDEDYPNYLERDSFFLDRATKVQDAPGSCFKLITSAAMIENDLDSFTCSDDGGEFYVAGTTLHNFGGKSYGNSIDLPAALRDSINIYFAKAALELGAEKLADTAKRFLCGATLETDFGTFQSNFGLTAESGKLQLTQTAFGQGRHATSPLFIALTMAGVLNDGEIMMPHIIDHIDDDGKEGKRTTPQIASHAVSASTAKALRKLLHSNAEAYGFDEGSYGMVYAKTGTSDAGDTNHIYVLAGIEVGGRKLAICLDRCNTTSNSGSLLPAMAALLQYLQSN